VNKKKVGFVFCNFLNALKNVRKKERKKHLTFNDFFFKYYFSFLTNNLFEKRVLGKLLKIKGSQSRTEIFL